MSDKGRRQDSASSGSEICRGETARSTADFDTAVCLRAACNCVIQSRCGCTETVGLRRYQQEFKKALNEMTEQYEAEVHQVQVLSHKHLSLRMLLLCDEEAASGPDGRDLSLLIRGPDSRGINQWPAPHQRLPHSGPGRLRSRLELPKRDQARSL
jgi:hypothetical protein